MSEWSDYQEEVAEFFRGLGLTAETNVTMHGVRTRHDVDVVVKATLAGLEVVWVVECKAWKSAVPKEKVLALREIVTDTGADRGFMMAEGGYQSGALEAALFANVMLTSIAELRERLAFEIGMVKLRSIRRRVASCRERYWAINKSDRIDFELRPEVGAPGYMGDSVILAVEFTERQATLRGFPIRYERTWAALSARAGSAEDIVNPEDEDAIHDPFELYEVLDAELSELERRLDAAEAVLRSR